MFIQKIKKLIYLLIIIILVIPARSQIFGFSEKKERPNFSYNVTPYPILNRDSVRLEIIMKVPYSSIQFVKEEGSYVAHFETSIYIYDSNDNPVHSYIKDNKARLQIFQKTTSANHFKIVKKNFAIAPGKYKITLAMNDFETQKTNVQEKEIDVSDYYTSDITISSINIIEKSTDSLSQTDNLVMSNTLLDTSNKF